MVGDRKMADVAPGTGDGTVRPDARAACNGRTAGHRSVRTDAHVMADLDLVVELDAVLDHGVVERAAVDGGVGTDLDVVAYYGTTGLRNLDPASRIGRHAAAVRPDPHPAVNPTPLPYDAPRTHR